MSRRLFAARVLADRVGRKAKVADYDLDLLAVAPTAKADGLPCFQTNHPCGRPSLGTGRSVPVPSRGASCFLHSGVQIFDPATGSKLSSRFQFACYECVTCRKTFVDADSRAPHKAPGTNRCGARLQWVWVE